MFQLSKKVEYGLIALRHMATGGRGHTYTVKEIADNYHISFELLSKIMQKLAKTGLIASHQGMRGGYTLVRDPATVTISSLIQTIENKPAVKIVQCEAEVPENCLIHGQCTIKDPLVKLQRSINDIFDKLTVTNLI
jgi:Rrf2 family protein